MKLARENGHQSIVSELQKVKNVMMTETFIKTFFQNILFKGGVIRSILDYFGGQKATSSVSVQEVRV